MDKKQLESKMKLFGDTNVTLAKYLNITPQTLSAKKNGNADFRKNELVKIKQRYNLTNDEFNAIFFAN